MNGCELSMTQKKVCITLFIDICKLSLEQKNVDSID